MRELAPALESTTETSIKQSGSKLPHSKEAAYREFVLELYHATPITGRTWLHGLKGGRMVHAGVAFKKIPREVLDKKAVEQGDMKFFELGALSVDVKQKGRELALKLSDFAIPTDDIPEEARKAIKHWSQLVLLGCGLGLQKRHVSQPVAKLPHAQRP